MSAVEALGHALADLADRGRATPCQGRRRDRWTSESAEDRAWAATVCVTLTCPVLSECGAAAAEFSAVFVWGGRDRTTTPPRPKPTKRTRRPGCEVSA